MSGSEREKGLVDRSDCGHISVVCYGGSTGTSDGSGECVRIGVVARASQAYWRRDE